MSWVLDTSPVVLGSRIFKILVGPEEQRFSIHEALLAARSSFFKSASLRHHAAEAETKTVKLPDVDPEIFALYEQLVYTSLIPGKRFDTELYPEDPARDFNPHDFCAKEYENLCGLYVMCEKIGDFDAKATASDALVAKLNDELADNDCNESGCFPGEKAINIMYEGSVVDSYGKVFLVGTYAKYLRDVPHEFPEATEVPVEFFRDLVKAMILRGGQIGC